MKKLLGMAMFVVAGLTPTAAFAAESYYYVHLDDGYCGMVACGDYGCTLIDRFPCPNEVSGD